jgi:hypothetical protein
LVGKSPEISVVRDLLKRHLSETAKDIAILANSSAFGGSAIHHEPRRISTYFSHGKCLSWRLEWLMRQGSQGQEPSTGMEMERKDPLKVMKQAR